MPYRIISCTLILTLLIIVEPVFGDQPYDEALIRILNALPGYIAIPSDNQPPTLCLCRDDLSLPDSENDHLKSFSSVFLFNSMPKNKNCDYVYAKKDIARQLLEDYHYKERIIISNYESFVDEGGALAIIDEDGVITIELNYGRFLELGILIDPDLIDVSRRVVR